MNRIVLTLGGLAVVASTALAQEAKKETPKDPPKINYAEHVLPIFREHCMKCHNANDAKGGLALDSFAALMEGGGSGEIVYDGDADGSRLYQLMIHEDTPVMPPNQDPIAKEKLDVIKNWINGGLLENSGSKARKKKGPSLSVANLAIGEKPEVISMPQSTWRVPVVVSKRAAASSALAVSPWAPLVAVGGQRQVALYNTDTAELLGILPYPEGIPQSIRFNVDGSYLLVAGGTHASRGVAAVYDIKTGQRVVAVGDELDTAFGADINESMSRIATGGPEKLVRIYDVASGDKLFELKKHTDWIYCVDYSPDGIFVASGDRSGGLHVWEADTGRLYLDLVGHKGAIRGISWRADSNVLVSASEDGTVKMWEMNEGKQLKSFNAHGGGATGIMMGKDGQMVTSGKDRTVKFWKADGGGIRTFPAFAEPALEAVITHDGSKVIGGDWSGRTVMWNSADPKQAVELAANPPTLQQQQAALTARVAELDKLVAQASANYANSQKGVEVAKAAHGGMVNKLAETKNLLAKANTDKAAADKKMADLKAQRASEDQKLKAANAKIATLDKQIKDATARLATANQQAAAATTRREAAKKELATAQASLTDLKANIAKVKQAATARLSQLTMSELDVAAKEQLAARTEANAENARKASEQKLNDTNGKIAALNAQIKTSTEKITALAAEKKASSELIVSHTAKVTESQKAVDAKNAQIAGIQKQIAEAKDDAQKKTLNEQLTKVQGELKSAQGVKAAADSQLSESKSKLASIDKQVVDLNNLIASSKKQLEPLAPQRDTFAAQLKQHLTNRDAAATEKAKHTAARNQVMAQIKAEEKNKAQTVAKIADMVAQENGLTAKVQQHQASANREEAARVAAANQATTEQQAIDKNKPLLAAEQAIKQTATKKIGELDAALKAQPGVIAGFANAIKQHSAAMPNIEKQIAAMKTKVDESNKAMVAAKTAVDTAGANASAAKKRLESIKTELVAFESHAAKLAAEFEQMQADADAKRKAVTPQADAAAKLTASMTARDAEMKKIAQTVAMLQAEMSAMQKSQATDKQSLDTVKGKLQELETAAEDAEAEAATRKDKLDFFKSAYGA